MRQLLAGIGLALIIALAVVYWNVIGRYAMGWPDRPANLESVGVVLDSIGLARSTVVGGVGLGSVTDLHPNGFGDAACPLVIGSGSALWPEGEGCPRRTVEFPRGTTHVDAVQWSGDGAPEFLSRGQWCCAPFLMDATGEVLWRFERSGNAVNDTAILRGGGGELGLVLTFNGGGGVIRLNPDGEQRWHREDGNVWQVATLDMDADGSDEIVHSNARGTLVVLDEDGELLSSAQPEGYLSDFDPLHWNGAPAILHVEDEGTLLLDLEAETLRSFANPWAFDLAEPRGAILETERGRWLVTLLAGQSFDRSVLAVNDAEGELLYAEVLEGGCEAVAAAGPASFWVGCVDQVLEYAAGQPALQAAAAR